MCVKRRVDRGPLRTNWPPPWLPAGPATAPEPAKIEPVAAVSAPILPPAPSDPPRLSLPIPAAGGGRPAPQWPAALADWALLLTPDDLPERLRLRPGTVVIDRRRFLAWLRADILRGPEGPRAMYGAIQSDLRCLRKALIPDREEPYVE